MVRVLVCLSLVGIGAWTVYFLYHNVDVAAGQRGLWSDGILENRVLALFVGAVGVWLTAKLLLYGRDLVRFRIRHGSLEPDGRETEAARRVLTRMPVSEETARRVSGLGRRAEFERVVSRLALASLIERRRGQIEAGLAPARARRLMIRRR